jgi:hypothetical protein
MSADFWAGYISGAAGIVVGNPLDLIKTRLQAGDQVAAHPTSPTSLRQTFDRAGTLVRGKKLLNTKAKSLRARNLEIILLLYSHMLKI